MIVKTEGRTEIDWAMCCRIQIKKIMGLGSRRQHFANVDPDFFVFFFSKKKLFKSLLKDLKTFTKQTKNTSCINDNFFDILIAIFWSEQYSDPDPIFHSNPYVS